MEDLTQLIVENQEFIWYLLGFFVFIYFIKFFIKLMIVLFFGWRKNKQYNL